MNDTMMIRNPETNEWESVYLPPTGDTYPIGAYAFIAGEKAPTGWLRADGQAVSRTEYAGLFREIGTTYGAGDGSTTFNLPNVNLANRTLVGSSGDGEFALGNTMGEKEHTLTINEIPSHAPIIMGSNVGGSNKAETVAYGGSANGTAMYATTPIGGGQSHNNMQPSIAAICIIKAKQSVGLVGAVTDDINDTNDNAVANAKTIKSYVDNKFNFNVIDNLDIGPNETVSEYSEQIKNAKIIIFAISCQGNTSAGSSSMFYIPNSGYAMYKTDFTADNKAFYVKTDENGNVITTDFNYDGQSKIKRIFYL